MEFVKIFAGYAKHKETGGHNDDKIDRANWKLSSLMFLLFAIIVSAKQYVGDPIECWCPAQFTSNYVSYTQQLCWVKNTYYIPLEEDIPKGEDLKPQVVYYQWTPFILLMQGMLFYIPSMVWQGFISHLGLSIRDLVESSQMFALASKFETRDQTVQYISQQIHCYLGHRHPGMDSSILQKIKVFCTKSKGNYIVTAYLFTKLLYIGNTAFQFYLLNWLLGTDFESLGARLLNSVASGKQLQETPQFPRITLCDFSVRGVGKARQPHTVECVLPINLFNEKIFIFIWFWLVFMAFLNIISIIFWLYKIISPWSRTKFVKEKLKISGKYEGEHRKSKLADFTTWYLRPDGVIVLRLLSMNSSDLVASAVTSSLFERYKELVPWAEGRPSPSSPSAHLLASEPEVNSRPIAVYGNLEEKPHVTPRTGRKSTIGALLKGKPL